MACLLDLHGIPSGPPCLRHASMPTCMCHAPSACLPPACRCVLQVRRAMEAENEKARRAAKREYNETVRLGGQCTFGLVESSLGLVESSTQPVCTSKLACTWAA